MIAPHELKNKAFNKAVRGYAMSEVDDYISFLIDKYTEVYRKNLDLEDELHKTKVKYSELHNNEESIRAVILKAQKLGENIVSQSRIEADKIVEASREICQKNVEEAEKKIDECLAEAEKIKAASEEFRRRLYDGYLSHLQIIKEMDVSLDLSGKKSLADDVESQTQERIERAKDKLETIRSDDDETFIV